ncbi:hypothetical protein [Jeongeupia chitinilytica]|uniref:YozE SAM-like domain-containing protein n=1 Tax=Jeongeupia chitinilytica TaxID=1041641 RepID=A0ABQ3GZG9_9NEIS|nr:hypothetical protein [Jeongeupia chitinilytica]GHD61142.1 hypothetical protein GCM10007350_15350 [Jeongeupia chitinilytica]
MGTANAAQPDDADFGVWLQQRHQKPIENTIEAAANDPSADNDWSDRLIFTLMHSSNRQRGNEPATKTRRELRDTYQSSLAGLSPRQHVLA